MHCEVDTTVRVIAQMLCIHEDPHCPCAVQVGSREPTDVTNVKAEPASPAVLKPMKSDASESTPGQWQRCFPCNMAHKPCASEAGLGTRCAGEML